MPPPICCLTAACVITPWGGAGQGVLVLLHRSWLVPLLRLPGRSGGVRRMLYIVSPAFLWGMRCPEL